MIFDPLTSRQGHHFDPVIKILLTFCSARHPHRFDMSHTKFDFFALWAPPAPQRPTPGT